MNEKGIIDLINKATLQLWNKKDKYDEDWRPCASAVLVKDLHSFYLLTACHVFPTDNLSIGFVRNNTFYPINGCRCLAPDSELSGKCDVAVLKLSDEDVKDLMSLGHTFISEEHLGINHFVNEDCRLYIVGYPASKTKETYHKANETNKDRFLPIVYSEPLCLLLPFSNDDSKYKKLGLEKHLHYLLDFHYKRLINEEGRKVSLPRPQGMSGSGLWGVTIENDFYLIGIMTDFDKEKLSIMQATRIDYATELMRIVFNSTVEQSNIIQPQWYRDN